MKNKLIIILLITPFITNAQINRFKSVNFSYLGEMITHPGLKIGLNYEIKNWQTQKEKKNGTEKNIFKQIVLNPSVGIFYHRNYQIALTIMPEIALKRQNEDKAIFLAGIGLGYLRTFIPNTFEVTNSNIEKTIAGHNYFASNCFVSIEKRINKIENIPVSLYIKPQYLFAIPNFPIGTGYFIFELGIIINIDKNE